MAEAPGLWEDGLGQAPLTLSTVLSTCLSPVKTTARCRSCFSSWEGFHKVISSELLILTRCANLPQTICIFIGNRESLREEGQRGEISTLQTAGEVFGEQGELGHF